MQLHALWELQAVDQSLEEISREIKQKELVMLLKEKQKNINDIQAIIEKEEKEIAHLEKRTKELEDELADLEIKKQVQEEKLYQGNSNNLKELENMKLKLEKIKEKISLLEDRALENMDILEDKVHLLNQHKGQLTLLKKEYAKGVKLYQKNKIELTDRKAQVERKHAELKSLLSESLLEIYQRVQKTFKNRGIAKVEKGFCSGCRVEIPIMHLKNIKTGDNIYTCEQCGRILIWIDTKTG